MGVALTINHMMNKYINIIVFWFVLFVSCSTPKKLNKIMNKLPQETAKECSVRFPVRESIDTVIVQDTAVIEMYEREFDYMYRYIDSLLSIKVDTQSRKDIMYIVDRLPAPPPVVKYVTKVVENTAKYQVIIDSCGRYSDSLSKAIAYKDSQVSQAVSIINKQASDIQKYKRERNQARWWLLLLVGIIFRRQIYRGAKRIITKI